MSKMKIYAQRGTLFNKKAKDLLDFNPKFSQKKDISRISIGIRIWKTSPMNKNYKKLSTICYC